jgi:hypothetical protein
MPRGQVLVDDPFRPSKVFEGHGLAVQDFQLAPVAGAETARPVRDAPREFKPILTGPSGTSRSPTT